MALLLVLPLFAESHNAAPNAEPPRERQSSSALVVAMKRSTISLELIATSNARLDEHDLRLIKTLDVGSVGHLLPASGGAGVEAIRR